MTTQKMSECCCKTIKENPLLSTGAVIGSTLFIASAISPTVRKVTVPTCKYLLKQQINLLAGVGILYLANYVTNNSDDITEIIL
ncbi:hypothetical protein CHL78_002950 [Romboutsia weinsteinii]|uniref:Uncharacterized protein n=1 Tax=Romboutsia weinsteinii TaxID=2020949 RepID=A0A371J897_9FIRM|nr:hypothetical protein [Romboutsia weinsteinii]RDY28896.1 hypothetical protein CHL78_002950 [Romboutsia weinsteinii]